MKMKACSVITSRWNTAHTNARTNCASSKRPAAGARQLRDAVQRQRREQQENHFAGEQVAVQAQRQRDRPRQERHDFQDAGSREPAALSRQMFLALKGCRVSSARKPPRPFTLML